MTGWARVHYQPRPADDVRLSVDAHAIIDPESGSPFSKRAWGRATLYHHVAGKDGVTMWASGRVDCVTAGGRSATVSMVVDRAAPVLVDDGWLDKRIGFSVYTGGSKDRARAGASGPLAVTELPKCMAPAPSMAVTHGGYDIATK